MDLPEIYDEFLRKGPETICAAFSQQLEDLEKKLRKLHDKPPAETAPGSLGFHLQGTAIDDVEKALAMSDEASLALLRFLPIMLLLQMVNGVAQFFPELKINPGRLLANWLLAHAASSPADLEADIDRLTEKSLTTHRDNLRSAGAQCDQPPRGGTPHELLDIPDRYNARRSEVLALIGPDGHPHHPGHDYEAALSALRQPEKTRVDPETRPLSGVTPATAPC